MYVPSRGRLARGTQARNLGVVDRVAVAVVLVRADDPALERVVRFVGLRALDEAGEVAEVLVGQGIARS